MAQLQRLVSACLDVAEDMALRQIPMTMQDWETRLNRFIAATDRKILQDAGKVTAESAFCFSSFSSFRFQVSAFQRFPFRPPSHRLPVAAPRGLVVRSPWSRSLTAVSFVRLARCC